MFNHYLIKINRIFLISFFYFLFMNTIFTVDDPENYVDKIDLDELYERKQQHDINTTNSYNTILNRIHNRIKTTSRKQLNEHYCWFVIPEMMIGVPRYDVAHCITYVMDKLQDNGFRLRYTHPNLLFISWKHWTPSYVRNEIRKKTGISIDGFGNKITQDDLKQNNNDINNILSKKNNLPKKNKEKTKDIYKDIDTYVPTGKFIYNDDIIHKLNKSKIINFK